MKFSEIAKMTEEEARTRLEKIRWPHGATCVHCGSMDVIKVNNIKEVIKMKIIII